MYTEMNLKPDTVSTTAFSSTNTGELPNVDPKEVITLGLAAGEEENTVTNI